MGCPILVTNDFEVVAGHGRLIAAKSLGLDLVPVVALSSLSEADKKALIIADNRIAELSNWDRDILAIEYQALEELQFDDIEVTGFSLGEIDTILDEAAEKQPNEPGPEDLVPALIAAPVSRKGDLWCLGSHRLLCGDARSSEDYVRLLQGQCADLVLTDPPFNCRIDGNVSGLGKIRHAELRWPRARCRSPNSQHSSRRSSGTPRPIPRLEQSCSSSWIGGTCSS
jgi:hypothetical protein